MVVFSIFAAVGPGIVCWSQNVLYGSPFRSGYGDIRGLYSFAYIPGNLVTYPRLLILVHTALIFLGLFASMLLLWPRVRARLSADQRQVVSSAVLLVLLNYLLYIAYWPVQDPAIVRFILPAFVALSVLLGGLLAHLSMAIAARSRVVAMLSLLIPTGVLVENGFPFVGYALSIRNEQVQLRLAGPYLDAVLPVNAAILTSVQGTGLAHFTKRAIVRLDCLDSSELDDVLVNVRLRGYHPVIVLESEAEASWFRARFPSSALRDLDWPARASALDRVRYWDPADRDPFAHGDRWSTDVLR